MIRRELPRGYLSNRAEVAAANPYSWFPRRRSAEEIITPSADNRMIGFPYTKYLNAVIEVDMAGMAPISDFVSTTSFYFHREFRNEPKGDRQPLGAIGSRPKPNFPRVTGPAGAPGPV